jgi:hypothetical protein
MVVNFNKNGAYQDMQREYGLTLTTRGMIPGSDTEPCIVWVLPDDVTPYANIVTV